MLNLNKQFNSTVKRDLIDKLLEFDNFRRVILVQMSDVTECVKLDNFEFSNLVVDSLCEISND